jgi:NADH-quinone oxidoreductase subunit L
MDKMILLIMILFPVFLGGLMFFLPKDAGKLKSVLLLCGFSVNLVFNILVFGKEVEFIQPWLKIASFSLRLYSFSSFILMSAAVLSFLTAIYTVSFSKNKTYNTTLFYSGMLLTLAMTNGVVLAANLLVMLFFWEAIMATIFMMITANGKNAYKTAVKAFIIAGVTDLCMMLGIGLIAHIAGTLDMDGLNLPLTSWGIPAFLLLVVGAVAKAGSMPFHTWLPDAADDAPMPFMAFLPGTLEKLLGIYLLSRIVLDIFKLEPNSAMSYTLMILGALTIICAVMMALIQKDFKRLLAYHAVSQVGYMILGIGTATPIGIIGGLFHMINNALYKGCLFFTAGAVEKQTGTTDLKQLGGLRKQMPVTFICFVIAAASIAGFPMTNGFFSKELIFDAALERGVIFYIFAAVGAFFTPVSFFKLGHSVFFGKPDSKTEVVKEAPFPMLIPMMILSAACLVFGLGQSFIVEHLLTPFLGNAYTMEHVHTNWVLVCISAASLILAFADHMRGYKKTGKGVKAADHYHYAPVLRQIYALAEKHWFDPYFVASYVINGFSGISLKINDAISWFYDIFVPRIVGMFTYAVKKAHNGSPARYIIWILGGVIIIFAAFKLL